MKVAHAAKAAMMCIAMISTGAYAQSRVTIFGVLDVGLQHSKNGVSSLSTESNTGMAGSRLGFSGNEELGGGLNALFLIEHGLSPDTGTQADPTRFWNRRSIVGFNGPWGEVRMGRDYTPTYRQWLSLDPFSTAGVGAITSLLPRLSNQASSFRVDNSVQYVLPSVAGLNGELMTALAESPSPNGNKFTGARLAYTNGGLFITAAYAVTEVTTLANGSNVKEAFLGGAYDFNVAKLSLNLSKRELGDIDLRLIQLGLTVPVSTAAMLKFAYNKFDNGFAANHDAKQLSLGAVYTLSSRTATYATYSRITNKSASALSSGSLAAVAGKPSTACEVGVRMMF